MRITVATLVEHGPSLQQLLSNLLRNIISPIESMDVLLVEFDHIKVIRTICRLNVDGRLLSFFFLHLLNNTLEILIVLT